MRLSKTWLKKRSTPYKGQLISKGLFGVIVLTKKTTKFFLRISPLASKKSLKIYII
jgi:hypothetical protein